jgi:glycosyltransferase involved in cell wall biosynthesis
MSMTSGEPSAGPASRPRILHLGFQDFRQPGSGGGAVRTHEINKRLSKEFEITVLTARYRGSLNRVEDGIRYVHIGYAWGYFGSIITYFIAVPFALRRFQADLVVEDFAAPFSSCLSPLWTRRKVIAMVQWLNAKEKSRQYHLPFWVVEALGLRLHRHYIAVSHDLADEIRGRRPSADVTVIANGVPAESFDIPLSQQRQGIVFLGRIERAQKGLDLLLDSYAGIVEHTSARLVIIGDGPDESWVRDRISELGLAGRVDLFGRLENTDKYSALGAARVIAMPSRFETFGMVAVEAFAAGTPVVAFRIPCLQEVVPPDFGSLVDAFDVESFASALLGFLSEDVEKDQLRQDRRNYARRFDWDTLAADQKRVYRRMMCA